MKNSATVKPYCACWHSSRETRNVARAPTRGRRAKHWLSLLDRSAITALFALGCYGGTAQATSQEQVLFRFTSGVGAGVISDGAGNLYGTTRTGGARNGGAVFQLSPPKAGQSAWTETTLYFFGADYVYYPSGALIADGAGNLYGTIDGGASDDGAVFELSPPQPGQTAWTEAVLHSFNNTDGNIPAAGLTKDEAGNLYGATISGGANDSGVVFELSPPPVGQTAWTETVLHSFNGADGEAPEGSLILDGVGNLYGVTGDGGSRGDGIVFELSPPLVGQTAWTETILHSFKGVDGQQPEGNLIVDGAGNLYGSTLLGGKNVCQNQTCGLVFELRPPVIGEKAWSEVVIHSFTGADGAEPDGLLADTKGNLYGATYSGGAYREGLLFKLSPRPENKRGWAEKVLFNFHGSQSASPLGVLISDDSGNLYGTANAGRKGAGVVFELTP